MTIHDLVRLAEAVHNREGYDLGSGSTREYRNAFWARVIGCAHHGHPIYNPAPDPRWHLKKAGPSSPQSDDVAAMLPSREAWDCIPGAGADGYYFEADYLGVLPAVQVIYVPPIPSGSAPVPPTPEPPSPTYPSYEELGGDEGGKRVTRLMEADYQRAEKAGLDGDSGAWQWRTAYDFLTRVCATVEESIAKHQPEWRQSLNDERAANGKPPIVW
jgi:hypothetical protein